MHPVSMPCSTAALRGPLCPLKAADPVTETIIRTEEAGADAFSTGGRASASSSAAAAAGLPAGRSKGGRGRSSIRMEVRVVDSISKVRLRTRVEPGRVVSSSGFQ